MRKKLTICVLPGVALAFTSFFLCNRQLMTLDLPTLDLPAKATSGNTERGNWAGAAALMTNSAEVIFIGFGANGDAGTSGAQGPRQRPRLVRRHHRQRHAHQGDRQERSVDPGAAEGGGASGKRVPHHQ